MSLGIAKILKSVLSEYHEELDLALVPIDVDLLKTLIEKRGCASRIILEKFSYKSKHIASQIGFYPDDAAMQGQNSNLIARIQLSASLNYCWRRFASCKEMYHCIIDEDPLNRVTNVESLSKLMEYILEDASTLLGEFPAHTTEIMAEILAVETLMPLELRQKHKPAFDNGQISALDLAKHYCLPEKYAALAMYPTYYSNMIDLRSGKMVNVD